MRTGGADQTAKIDGIAQILEEVNTIEEVKLFVFVVVFWKEKEIIWKINTSLIVIHAVLQYTVCPKVLAKKVRVDHTICLDSHPQCQQTNKQTQ